MSKRAASGASHALLQLPPPLWLLPGTASASAKGPRGSFEGQPATSATTTADKTTKDNKCSYATATATTTEEGASHECFHS
ncbi:MAG: hypothetical protein ACKPKO_46125, partial [Candidatus Fonsibacter sp.]